MLFFTTGTTTPGRGVKRCKSLSIRKLNEGEIESFHATPINCKDVYNYMVHSYIDVITVRESPASPIYYRSSEARLTLEERDILSRGEELSDKHITGCNKILQHEFPDMPSPQSCLLSQKPEQLEPAEENSVLFHHYNQHWAVSQLRYDTVYICTTQCNPR